MRDPATRRHFESGGADYARHRPTYPPELARLLAAEAPRRGHALDLGCGTGQLSVLLASEFDRVTATDPSASQIASAETRDNIRYAIGSAEAIDLPSGSVDLIVAAQAAHWFDLPAFYAEARRIAAPGAALALVSYGVPQLSGPAGARFAQFYGQDSHEHWPPDRDHVESGYRSLDFPFAERGLPPLTITRDWSLSDLAGYVETWSATKQARKTGAGAQIDAGMAEIGQLWGDPATQYRVSWPLTARIATLDQAQT